MNKSPTVTVFFPTGVRVFVTAITNAAFLQRIVITLPNGRIIRFIGRGEGRVIATSSFIAPPGRIRGVSPVRVTMTHLSGERIVGSKVFKDKARFSRAPFQVIGVFSEDSVDNDFNDAIVTFTFQKPRRNR